MPDPADVLLDPAAAYPAVGPLRAAIAGRDWAATRAVLDAVPAGERSLLIRLGGDEKDLEPFLRSALERDPDDAAASAMLGAHLIGVGWTIRTAARAKHVSREQFTAFFGWLRKAEQVLIEAAARNPGEPAVWVARLISARGLQLGLAETRRRYDRLRALDPHHYSGQGQFLQSLCPKWSGSWAQLHGWAREELLGAPLGSISGALVAEAHIEHWLDLKQDERTAYLAHPQVRNELLEAAHRSIWHEAFDRTAGWVRSASAFAMAFSLVGDEQAAAASFALLGPLAAEYPWQYLGTDVAATIRQRRERAYAAGGVR